MLTEYIFLIPPWTECPKWLGRSLYLGRSSIIKIRTLTRVVWGKKQMPIECVTFLKHQDKQTHRNRKPRTSPLGFESFSLQSLTKERTLTLINEGFCFLLTHEISIKIETMEETCLFWYKWIFHFIMSRQEIMGKTCLLYISALMTWRHHEIDVGHIRYI